MSKAAGERRSLETVAIFEDFPPETLKPIEDKCHWRTFHAGEQIVGHLDNRTEIFFIISGRAGVRLYSASGRAIGFREIVAGEFFGEFSAIDRQPRSATVEAETECIIASLGSNDFWHIAETNPTFLRAMLVHLVTQLRRLTNRVYEFSTLTVNNRVQAELLRLAQDVAGGDEIEDSIVIPDFPTHVEIAARISTHREAVTRHLAELTRSGLIKKQGRDLLITDIEELRDMVAAERGE